MRTNQIVVGVDGSNSAMRAARWAATEAHRRSLPLRLVHASEIPIGYPVGMVDPRLVREGFDRRGWRWLRAARDAVSEIAPALPVELELKRGTAVPALVTASDTASMIVLGTRGLGGFTGLLVGSTAVALAGRVDCPVVVARGRHPDAEPPSGGPVIVGVDGTPAGEAGIAFAFEHAAVHGRGLVAVHAWSDTLLEAAMAGYTGTFDPRPMEQQAHELLAERLAGWPEKYPEVKVTREVVHDRPTRALLRHADGAALVVVGTRGLGGFRGLLLGSTSQQLLHYAPCPVAVVRTEPDGVRAGDPELSAC